MNVACWPVKTDSCGWLDDSTVRKPFESIKGSISAPYAVVGSGFTGLSAARQLAERLPDQRIVLIDAAEIGDGASSRNCGFVVPIGHFEGDWRSHHNERLYRLGLAGIRELGRLVDRFQIKCDWNESGRLIVARSRFAMQSLTHKKRVLQQLGAPVEEFSGLQIEQITGLQGYCAAIRQADSVLVNPAALVRGLAENLPPNVSVFERSPVRRIQPGESFQLECEEGSIETANVLLTTNGHLGSFGFAKNRVFPMRTFASIAKRPAGKCPMGSGNWGITSSERIGSSLRRLAGNRILIRNTACYGYRARDPQDELNRVAKIHARTLERRFSRSGPWSVEKTWGGVISVSANGAGYFGQLQPGIWAVAGHNGHGIAHGTIAGQLLADMAIGRRSALLSDIQNLPAPSWIPRGWPLQAGVSAAVRYLTWRGRHEI